MVLCWPLHTFVVLVPVSFLFFGDRPLGCVSVVHVVYGCPTFHSLHRPVSSRLWYSAAIAVFRKVVTVGQPKHLRLALLLSP